MDECVITTTTTTTPAPAETSGDVDDLIFLHSPDWYASER